MTFKVGRVEELKFTVGSLTANSAGLFSVFSDRPINGHIDNIYLFENNHTTTGSYLILTSGLYNSGTALGGLIITLRAGSFNQDYHPQVYPSSNQSVLISGPTGISSYSHGVNDVIRIVGSGLGDGTSGLGIRILYN